MYMVNYLKRTFNNRLIKNILLLMTGTGLAQILTVVLSPVITRIYNPTDYGTLALYTSALSLLSLIGSLKYDSAIPIADNDKKAINIFVLCLLILVSFGG